MLTVPNKPQESHSSVSRGSLSGLNLERQNIRKVISYLSGNILDYYFILSVLLLYIMVSIRALLRSVVVILVY